MTEVALLELDEHAAEALAAAPEAFARHATPPPSLVRAHTLPEMNPSCRVLEKAGFRRLGEVIDPEDGRVWRWERAVSLASGAHQAAPRGSA